VALIDENDPDHASCVTVLKSLTGKLATVWPAITEAMYLLTKWPDAQSRLWDLLDSPQFSVAFLDRPDFRRMRDLMRQYADLPMDLADAALVVVAERERIRTVFTLDQRDFRIYRPRHIRAFTIVPEIRAN
jgi:predicted nucleic acid-binding protein